jgi:ERCC4-type nuclease
MSDGLIVPNEPRNIKDLFPDFIECPQGFDMKLFTEAGTIGIERKHVPDDLLSSVADGRLGREILAMREECNFQVVLLHGIIRYHSDGTVNFGRKVKSRWTAVGVRNLLRTIQYVEGCYIEQAYSSWELPIIVAEMQSYFDRKVHLSMKSRPGVQRDWLVPTKDERIIRFYQGLPGIAVMGAKKLYDMYPNPFDLFNANIEDLMSIPKFGRTTSTRIYNFLRGIT